MSQGFALGTPGATGAQGPPGSSSTPSGVTLAQQAVAGPFTLQGRFTLGSGIREDLLPGSVASLIGGRWGSGLQLLQAPTAVRGGMLRDDGQFVLPSFVASGVGLTQLADISSPRLLGRASVGSGSPEQLAPGQVASMLGAYAGSGLGMVPTPTGPLAPTGLTSLLDNGQWGTPPMPHLIQTFASAAGAWASGQFITPIASQNVSTTENRAQIPIMYDCLLTHVVAHQSRAGGGTGINSFVLRVDGSNTSFAPVIGIGGFNATATGVFTATSGQLLSVMCMTGVDAAATSAGLALYGRPR